jgi:hypothetical protein
MRLLSKGHESAIEIKYHKMECERPRRAQLFRHAPRARGGKGNEPAPDPWTNPRTWSGKSDSKTIDFQGRLKVESVKVVGASDLALGAQQRGPAPVPAQDRSRSRAGRRLSVDDLAFNGFPCGRK